MKLPIVEEVPLTREDKLLPIPTVVLAVIRVMEARCPSCGSDEVWSDAQWYCEPSDLLTTETYIPRGCGFSASEDLVNRVQASNPDNDGDEERRATELQALAEEAVAYFRALCVRFGRCPSCGDQEFIADQACAKCGFAYTKGMSDILNGCEPQTMDEQMIAGWYRQAAQEGAAYSAVPREG